MNARLGFSRRIFIKNRDELLLKDQIMEDGFVKQWPNSNAYDPNSWGDAGDPNGIAIGSWTQDL